ncbi:MAG: hypothetical protein IT342_21790 [Candidatus Melainabacteria bacterium]|nr:hypothetical protein [Candidatus Melainabacteria bacterium]
MYGDASNPLAWRLVYSASLLVSQSPQEADSPKTLHRSTDMIRLRLAMIALVALVLSGCAGMQFGPGTTTGAAVGAVGGAVINRENPAAGAIIGTIIGGAIGSTVDNNNGNYSGPVYNGGHRHGGHYDRCDWRCQDYRRAQEQARRDAIRREEVRRQLEWQEYCRYNWRRDYRCGR